MRQTGRQPILTVSRVHKILEFPPEKDEINNLVDLELIQKTPSPRIMQLPLMQFSLMKFPLMRTLAYVGGGILP